MEAFRALAEFFHQDVLVIHADAEDALRGFSRGMSGREARALRAFVSDELPGMSDEALTEAWLDGGAQVEFRPADLRAILSEFRGG